MQWMEPRMIYEDNPFDSVYDSDSSNNDDNDAGNELYDNTINMDEMRYVFDWTDEEEDFVGVGDNE